VVGHDLGVLKILVALIFCLRGKLVVCCVEVMMNQFNALGDNIFGMKVVKGVDVL